MSQIDYSHETKNQREAARNQEIQTCQGKAIEKREDEPRHFPSLSSILTLYLHLYTSTGLGVSQWTFSVIWIVIELLLNPADQKKEPLNRRFHAC